MQTLADLVTSFHIYAVCVPCRRMERLPLQQLIERYGPGLGVDAVRRRVRCGGCGQRTEDVRIVYVGPASSAAEFRYRRR